MSLRPPLKHEADEINQSEKQNHFFLMQERRDLPVERRVRSPSRAQLRREPGESPTSITATTGSLPCPSSQGQSIPDRRHGFTRMRLRRRSLVRWRRSAGGLHRYSGVGAARPKTQHWCRFQAQASSGRSDVSTRRPSGLTQRRYGTEVWSTTPWALPITCVLRSYG